MIVLTSGKTLGPGDLGLNVRDAQGNLVQPAAIGFSIFQVSDDGQRTLATTPKACPANPSTGTYYISGSIPTLWEGRYDLVWYLTQYPGGAECQTVEEFEVVRVDPATSSFEAPSMLVVPRPGTSPKINQMIVMVRELLSDTRPDRNYHFRPPTPGKTVANFNSRVGFIWLDQTIQVFLDIAIGIMNTANPMSLTNYTLATVPTDWAKVAAFGAASMCLSAEGARWTEEEFGYSLNGVSLDINKSANYQSLATAYKAAFDAAVPNVTANRPFTSGLRQQRWLLG